MAAKRMTPSEAQRFVDDMESGTIEVSRNQDGRWVVRRGRDRWSVKHSLVDAYRFAVAVDTETTGV